MPCQPSIGCIFISAKYHSFIVHLIVLHCPYFIFGGPVASPSGNILHCLFSHKTVLAHWWNRHHPPFLIVTSMLHCLASILTMQPSWISLRFATSPDCGLFRPLCPLRCPFTHLSPSHRQRLSPLFHAMPSLPCPIASPDTARLPPATFSWSPRSTVSFHAGCRINLAHSILCLFSNPSCLQETLCFVFNIAFYFPHHLPAMQQIYWFSPWHLLPSWPALMLHPVPASLSPTCC